MDHDREIASLAAETLALQAVVTNVLRRVGSANPAIGNAISPRLSLGLMVRSVAQRRVSNHGPSAQAAPHRPPSSFEAPVLAARERAPQEEDGSRLARNTAARTSLSFFILASSPQIAYTAK